MQDLGRLSNRSAQLSSNLSLRLLQRLWRMWGPLTPSQMWSDTLTAGLGAAAVPLVESTILQQQRSSRAYATRALEIVGAKPKDLAPVELVYPRYDSLISEVYQRPATEYRWLVSQGTAPEAAMRFARRRLETIADTDVHRAGSTEETDTYQAAPTAVGFRRVPHPELSQTGTCGLCWAASQQFYTLGDLLDLHDGCHCKTSPITAGADPGITLTGEDLKSLYEAAGSTFREDLQRIRIKTVQNGELGPILTHEGHGARGPRESSHTAYQKPTAADQRAANERQLEVATIWAGNINQAIKAGHAHEFEWAGKTYKAEPNEQALTYQQQLIKTKTRQLAGTK